MLASVLLQDVRDALNDPDAITWGEPDLIGYLNQALRMLVIPRPDACAENAVLTLAAGTEQTLPAGGLRLLSIFCNANGSNAPIGPAVRHIERLSLDDVMASWMTATPSASCYEYWYDERNPTRFWTNPVQAGVKVKALYSKTPTVITAGTDTLPVDDAFSAPLQEWMLYLAWRGDDETSPTHVRAMAHRQACMDLLGIKAGADASSSPKASGG